MSRYVFKLPDLGEGTVSAEIVGWHVKPGDVVEEEQVLVEVMTEKAAVEVPSPVSGRVLSTTGEPGELVAVGAELIVLETGAAAAGEAAKPAALAQRPAAAAAARGNGAAGRLGGRLVVRESEGCHGYVFLLGRGKQQSRLASRLAGFGFAAGPGPVGWS